MEIVLPLLATALLVAGLVIGWHREQRRRERLRGFCLSKGWQFVGQEDGWCHRWVGDPFSSSGSEHKATNVMQGEHAGRTLVAFDYSYVTVSHDSNGRSSKTTHRYAVCALKLPLVLSTLQVTGETLFTRAVGFLGMDDIELESEDFNRRFRVSAANRKFASDVLTPRTMEALLRLPVVSWRIEGDYIVGWGSGRNAVNDVLVRASTMAAVVAGVPSFVWRDHGAPVPEGPIA